MSAPSLDANQWDASMDREPEDVESVSKINSCMHYYKRDLSPIKENYAQLNTKTPYR